MMKITPMQGNNGVAQLRIEGRVTQEAAEELSSSCHACLTDHHSLLLDLSGVQFVDEAGIEAFRRLRQRGAVLLRCSGFLSELLQTNAVSDTSLPESAMTDEFAGEAQLLAGLRRGEEIAFERLVRQYSGRLLATARRLLGNEHDAQDALQDAFLSAFKSLSQFTGAAKLSTWLHRIVVNAALMKLRNRRRKPEESIEELLPHFDAQGEWSGRVPTWQVSSDMLLQRRETRTLVRRCIDCLPETYRTVLLLRDIEDLDTEEVATLLGVTANAVKIRLHRARQALRTLLEQGLTGELHAHAAQ